MGCCPKRSWPDSRPMLLRALALPLATICLAVSAHPQELPRGHVDPFPVLDAAAKAMGVDALRCIAFSGTGESGKVGQNVLQSTDWPKGEPLDGYTRTIDFVESRRGAPVERWRGHGFRRPAPSHLCLDTPLQLRFLSPLIEPSMRISRTGLSFEIMRSHTRSRAVRPVRRSRPLCDRPPGKRTSSRTPPRASAPATDATAMSPAPVLPTAAARPPGTRFTSRM